MKLSIVPTIYLVDGSIARTGAFVCARAIARALDGRARVILVISSESKLVPEDTADFGSVLRLPICHLRRSLRAVLLYLPCLILSSVRLAHALRRDQAEMLIVNDFHMMQGAICRLIGFRGKILTWVRINPNAFGRVSRVWLWAAQRSSDRVIAVSRYIGHLLPKGMKADLLYDGIAPRYEEPIGISTIATLSFVFIGNYILGKGQDVAVEAMAIVVKSFPDARLEFYGGDMGLDKNRAYLNALVQRARDLGISDNIYFGGFVVDPLDKLKGKIAALNLSRSESFSMTVLEASACGLATIATRSGGPEEIVADGETGVLVPVDDPISCAEAMMRLCADPSLARKMGEAGRRRVLSSFSNRQFRLNLIHILDLG